MKTVEDYPFENDEYFDNQDYEICPKCGWEYDHIDFDFQICSKCGWDVQNKIFTRKRKPNYIEFNGDADMIYFLDNWKY